MMNVALSQGSEIGAVLGGGLGLILIFLLILLCVLWIILPFGVFGMNTKLYHIQAHLEQQTKLLKEQSGLLVRREH